jgi:hypothetical protein
MLQVGATGIEEEEEEVRAIGWMTRVRAPE